MHTARFAAALATTTLLAWSLCSQQANAAPPDDNTGVSSSTAVTYVPPANLSSEVAAKRQLVTALTSTTSNSPFATLALPTSATAPGWGFTIFKEGQGNGKKSYTCGPSATRNLVYAKSGIDYGEAQFASWEGTTTTGTAINNIASTLNTRVHQHFTDALMVDAPTSTTDLRAKVAADVYYKHGSIPNVYTGYLTFFNGHYLRHYDVIYGYSPTTLAFAEEWDPVYIYGSASYQPYGKHAAEPLTNAYNAIHNSPTGQMVW